MRRAVFFVPCLADAFFPEVAAAAVAVLEKAGAHMGCLMNIGGRLSRLNLPIKVLHIARILAGNDRSTFLSPHCHQRRPYDRPDAGH